MPPASAGIEPRFDLAQPRHRPRQELAGRRRVAQIVGPLAVEPEAAVASVQPRPHPVALFRRRRDVRQHRQRNPADARERVLDDLRLELQLSRVGDVREHVAAAAPVHRGPPIPGGGDHLGGLGERDALPRALDARPHALAGDGVGHEHDLPVVPRQHPAASRRLLDVEGDDRAWRDHSKVMIGRRWRSRSRRVDTGAARSLVGRRQHPVAERRQFGLGLAFERRRRGLVGQPPRGVDQPGVERPQALQAVFTRLAAQPFRRRPHPVQLAHDRVELGIERARLARAGRRQPGDDPLEMGRQCSLVPGPCFPLAPCPLAPCPLAPCPLARPSPGPLPR